ncbi:MAG: redoxin domain-containing protein [Anaerolineae bacterium]|nr:redoxin domain-containing protein [Anaerolineae bacterium]
MKRLTYFLVICAVLMFTFSIAIAQQGDSVSKEQFEGRTDLPLPEFPDGLDWLNVSAPLRIDDLRGKVVLLDFWTYGCINCIHMIPTFKQLEEKYPDELVIIGVHSAKFANEGETDNIRQIILRYEIDHPIINDSDFRVWQLYGAQAWPTLVIADPRGNVLAADAGEIPFDVLDTIIGGMVGYFDDLGEIDRTPLPIAPIRDEVVPSALAFPGKILIDAPNNRLFIADSGHHRIIIADLTTYEVLEVIGTGVSGLDDGDFAIATFNQPHGMALRGDKLYVAEAKNHVIREIDLTNRTVEILAGTGTRGERILPFSTPIREPRAYDMRSPWDVATGAGDTLFIASAGTHQIWEMNLQTEIVRVSVGNGREAMLNTKLDTSELAQPSGLYFRDGLLYFADSESSTVRVADYTNNTVMTISGTLENNLFQFGDVDGAVGTSRLQHPLGVTGAPDGTLYIADTYNHKIKAVDETLSTTTIFGLGGVGGFADGDAQTAQFDEPADVKYHDGKLYVADTNNHAIRVIDLTANTVSTVVFPNPEKLRIAQRVTVIGGNVSSAEAVILPAQTVKAGQIDLIVRFTLPEGYKINAQAPSFVRLDGFGNTALTEIETRIPITLEAGATAITGEIDLFYCEAVDESLCFIDTFRLEIPISLSDLAQTSEIVVARSITPPTLRIP